MPKAIGFHCIYLAHYNALLLLVKYSVDKLVN